MPIVIMLFALLIYVAFGIAWAMGAEGWGLWFSTLFVWCILVGICIIAARLWKPKD